MSKHTPQSANQKLKTLMSWKELNLNPGLKQEFSWRSGIYGLFRVGKDPKTHPKIAIYKIHGESASLSPPGNALGSKNETTDNR